MNTNIERTAALRSKMAENGVDAYIILTDDFHASEYVSSFFKCREFISSFTGSAGTLLVMRDEACLWADGRYFIQAEEQLSGGCIKLMKMKEPGVPTLNEFMRENIPENAVIGYDGRTVNAGFADELKAELAAKNPTYKENLDLVGEIWEDRPAFPASDIWELSAEYTGMTRGEKLGAVRTEMAKKGADCFLLSSLDDIAWIYNLRGDDVKCNPVFMSYTLVSAAEAVLYANEGSFSEELIAALKADGVTLKPYLAVYDELKKLPTELTVLIDRNKLNVALLAALPEGIKTVSAMNPTEHMKACKTETEMKNIRIAHIQDGVAVTKIIHWLREAESSEEYLDGRLTELDVADKLHEFRLERTDFLGESFESIIATGAHGAINHYSPTEKTNAAIVNNCFLLMDTGGQYLQGTSDITRTVAMGEVSEEQKRNYTAVLRGNLDLASAKFRYGCTGANLDILARAPLWELGLNFNHGTGHGVGYLLNVHEGPQRIHVSVYNGGGSVFEHGMLTSNEPGLYIEGEYGIRLENLMLCVEDETTAFGRFMRFDTVTMVPFDRRSIIPEMLSEREKSFLNAYNAEIYKNLAPYMTEKELAWLRDETRPF